MADEDITVDKVDWDKWPRAELVGGPMDGVKILAPVPKFRCPLPFLREDVAGDETSRRMHWYVPMNVTSPLRQKSIFYYAYAGDTDPDDEPPAHAELYNRSTTAHPSFDDDNDA